VGFFLIIKIYLLSLSKENIIRGRKIEIWWFMPENEFQTHLIKKVAKFPKYCTQCDNEIETGEAYHQEEGVEQHLHSLIARRFCSDCYAKYGERKLLSGVKK
jgi:hypothetical protein